VVLQITGQLQAPSPFTESKDNMATTYEKIATTTLGTANTTIDFTSIAASWTDIKLVLVYGKSTAGNIAPVIRLNGDTGTNYSQTLIKGDGTSATSTRATSVNYWANNASIANPQFGLLTLDIFSYTGSTNKTGLITNSVDANGAGTVESFVCLWRSTAAINQITISATTSYAVGTTATLYGILKA
jgi:hypothetical protein